MSALRHSRPAACPHATIHDLPAPLLAHIFSCLSRSDALSALLVNKAWLAVAGEYCGALWDVLRLDGDRVCLEGAQAKKGFQAGFRKRAGYVSVLHVLGSEETFTALLPSLLQTLAACLNSRLRELDLEVVFLRRQHYTACCRAVAQLRALRSLGLKALPDDQSSRRADALPLAPLLQLSSLSCLERLAVGLDCRTDAAPVFDTLLPSLASLTQLDLDLDKHRRTVEVSWRRPDGSGPSLRHVQLSGCSMRAQDGPVGAELVQRSLQHVERLELLWSLPLAGWHLSDALPQLPALTSLVLDRPPGHWLVLLWVLEAVPRCPHLQELTLALGRDDSGGRVRLPRHLPPGSLQQLTKLAVVPAEGDPPPAWRLPQLKHLDVNLRDAAGLGVTALQPLALNPTVEELVLRADVPISWATQTISELQLLTRLTIYAQGEESPELHGGSYLACLKELALHQAGCNTPHTLPQALEQATALEQLDLAGNKWLALQKEDVRLLAKLPRLKAVRLPAPGPGELRGALEAHLKLNVVVVKHMQQKLGQGGVRVEAVPLWEVDEQGGRWVLLV